MFNKKYNISCQKIKLISLKLLKDKINKINNQLIKINNAQKIIIIHKLIKENKIPKILSKLIAHSYKKIKLKVAPIQSEVHE